MLVFSQFKPGSFEIGDIGNSHFKNLNINKIICKNKESGHDGSRFGIKGRSII
jgi:hypothetical protein